MKTLMLFLGLSLASGLAIANETEVPYKSGDQDCLGFLVTPKGKAKYGAVLIVHDWLGLTDKTKDLARKYAALGYTAFAADIYGKGIRPTQETAGAMAGKYKGDRPLFRKRLLSALETLKAQKDVSSSKIAVAGYCFGGTGALELARTGADVQAVLSFHGGLDSPTPADGKNIKGRVLVLHGADDPFEKPADLTAFEDEMRSNHVDWQLVKFGGAVHSFTDKTVGTDNSKGAAYNEKADTRSWKLASAILEETLK